MSEEFKFEDRYIVIKRSDVERFWRDDVRDQFMAALGRLNEHDVRIPQRQYLVIESDWPEFYPAFQMIEARVNGKPAELEVLRAQLANTEQSRRSFFDLSQGLEKRLAYMVEAMNQIVQVSSMYEKPFEIATLAIGELSAMVITPKCCEPTADELASLAAGDYTPEELWGGSKPTCPKCHKAESGAPTDDIPDFTPGNGNKAKRRIAAMEASKPKTCIECDQPYCHGVCVERGDQDYDRDQAAKGGDDE